MIAIKKSNLKNLVLTIGVLLIANGIGNTFPFETSDKRYTLSETSLNIIEQVRALVHKKYTCRELPLSSND
jgi:hypothetical protein